MPTAPPSPWPSLRSRASSLLRDVYAEMVTEGATYALSRLPPPAAEGAPPSDEPPEAHSAEMGVLTSSALWTLSVLVAGVGALETAVSRDSLPCREIREATAAELRVAVGTLNGRDFLPSAYDPWVGPRSAGLIRLRYGYDAAKLDRLLRGPKLDLMPVGLDQQTKEWVRARLAKPAAASRLAVWRALKRRMYHYDAGVVAFHAFPRNYLLSPNHWCELLADRPTSCGGVALDVGAGDGSLSSPYASLFSTLVLTELTAPLCWRLKATATHGANLETHATAELTPHHLGGRSAFDVAFCLNVLDRCKDPMRLLSQMRALLPERGWLVVSVVVPTLQSDAATSVGVAQRRWRVTGNDFESAAASLVDTLLIPAGFSPRRLVRAPYFCAGDRFSPVAVLDAAIFVLVKTTDAEMASARASMAQGVRSGTVSAFGEAALPGQPTQLVNAPPRRSVSPSRPPLAPPSTLTSSGPSQQDEVLVSDHAHLDETHCDDCDALGGYKFGAN